MIAVCRVHWDTGQGAATRCANTGRPLTHLSDLSGRQAGMDDIPGERWLPVPGFEGRYDVSDQGRVRSWLPWRGKPLPRLLSPAPDTGGYPSVLLSPAGGTPTMRTVHLLVLAAFVGPRPDDLETRHLDGDSMNGRLTNLAYGTKSENGMDMVHHGTHNMIAKTHCPQGHPYDAENTYWLRDGRGRACRVCRRASDHRQYLQRKASR